MINFASESKLSSPGTHRGGNPAPPYSMTTSSNMNSGSKETLRLRNQIKNQALNEMEFQKFQRKFQSDIKSPSFSATSRHVNSVLSHSAKKSLMS